MDHHKYILSFSDFPRISSKLENTHTQPPSHANTINMHRIYVHAMCAEIEFMQRQENRRIVLVVPVWRVRDFYIAVAISVRYALNAINTLAV